MFELSKVYTKLLLHSLEPRGGLHVWMSPAGKMIQYCIIVSSLKTESNGTLLLSKIRFCLK